jgi:hypothetical protein
VKHKRTFFNWDHLNDFFTKGSSLLNKLSPHVEGGVKLGYKPKSIVMVDLDGNIVKE